MKKGFLPIVVFALMALLAGIPLNNAVAYYAWINGSGDSSGSGFWVVDSYDDSQNVSSDSMSA